MDFRVIDRHGPWLPPLILAVIGLSALGYLAGAILVLIVFTLLLEE